MILSTLSLWLLCDALSTAPGADPAVGRDGTEFDLYVLAGQSNMDGYGKVSELPEGLRDPMERVFIFHGNPAEDGTPRDGAGGLGSWTRLRPGHGRGFAASAEANRYSDAFGLELSFARALRDAHPERPIAIVKYSRGGTSIDQRAAGHFGCWDPDFEDGEGAGAGVNQYDHFLATMRRAMAARDVDGDGAVDHLRPAGILWMQGESDAAYTEEIARGYEAKLRRLMGLMRAALHHDDVPVVIGRISDSGRNDRGQVWLHGDLVRSAQKAYVESDRAAVLVTSTDDYGYSDPYHYDSAGYLDLGRRFAAALAGLRERE